MKILIIEDDQDIVQFLKKSLSAKSFLVEDASDGERGAFLARTGGYDLVILDNSLPKMSGLEVLKEIRQDKKHLPIIMLTVKAELSDKKTAFDLGADDYLTKPFLLEELIMRIEALLRRPKHIKNQIIKLGNLLLDSKIGCFKRGGKELYLTRREFCLLEYLLRRKNEIVSRGEILENVWDYNADPFSNSIETHIASLRRKLNSGGQRDIIHTFSGRGYKLALKKMD
ncbi:MAG TPA: response regulator transcription factor [Candidatus Saccharimonadales bacterium]|nr:response regulator transcription factor [Candidatus Saccharimonadales bacterium]